LRNGTNRYAYCNNNPRNAVDPSGRETREDRCLRLHAQRRATARARLYQCLGKSGARQGIHIGVVAVVGGLVVAAIVTPVAGVIFGGAVALGGLIEFGIDFAACLKTYNWRRTTIARAWGICIGRPGAEEPILVSLTTMFKKEVDRLARTELGRAKLRCTLKNAKSIKNQTARMLAVYKQLVGLA
jgi:hypothetical protein